MAVNPPPRRTAKNWTAKSPFFLYGEIARASSDLIESSLGFPSVGKS
jgi:hypothetical protein